MQQEQRPLPEKTHRRFRILALVITAQLYLLSFFIPATRSWAIECFPIIIGTTFLWSLASILENRVTPRVAFWSFLLCNLVTLVILTQFVFSRSDAPVIVAVLMMLVSTPTHNLWRRAYSGHHREKTNIETLENILEGWQKSAQLRRIK